MADEERWFEVSARVKVKHTSEREAERHVVDALSTSGPSRVFPVGIFHVEPCDDPTVRPSERA